MGEKPSYLRLLNAIAVGELGGEAQFAAWEAATPNDDVRAVVRTVALREAEHARSFAKRLDELGYSVLDRPDPGLARRVKIAASTELSDCEKLEQLGFSSTAEARPDVFASFFDDTTIDPVTGALMGRYIAEERDTGRLLRACHAELAARAPEPAVTGAAAKIGSQLGDQLERLDRIESALTSLGATVAATAKATAKGSGGAKAKTLPKGSKHKNT